MTRCAACDFWIPWGGIRAGDYRYCCDECVADGPVIPLSRTLPATDVRLVALKLHGGPCPRCKGPGRPVEVRPYYRVWSIVVLTHWSTRLRICCRACGFKLQLGSIGWCMLLGWWGLPLGVLMTPVQIVRNLVAMVFVPDPRQPSPRLVQAASITLAQERLAEERARR